MRWITSQCLFVSITWNPQLQPPCNLYPVIIKFIIILRVKPAHRPPLLSGLCSQTTHWIRPSLVVEREGPAQLLLETAADENGQPDHEVLQQRRDIICLKSPCTSISASSAVLAVQGLLRQILHLRSQFNS